MEDTFWRLVELGFGMEDTFWRLVEPFEGMEDTFWRLVEPFEGMEDTVSEMGAGSCWCGFGGVRGWCFCR